MTNASLEFKDRIRGMIQRIVDMTTSGHLTWKKTDKSRYKHATSDNRSVSESYYSEDLNITIGSVSTSDDSNSITNRNYFLSAMDEQGNATETFYDVELYSPFDSNILYNLVNTAKYRTSELDGLLSKLDKILESEE